MIQLPGTTATLLITWCACTAVAASTQCPSDGIPKETLEEVRAYAGSAAAYEGNIAQRGGTSFSVTLSGCLTTELVVVWETRDGTARGSAPGPNGQPGVCGAGDDYEGRQAGVPPPVRG